MFPAPRRPRFGTDAAAALRKGLLKTAPAGINNLIVKQTAIFCKRYCELKCYIRVCLNLSAPATKTVYTPNADKPRFGSKEGCPSPEGKSGREKSLQEKTLF